jgi:HAD superfamily hydrolase (TIGR01549 family)
MRVVPNALFPSSVRAVLFDIDGTLVDTLPALIPGLGDAYVDYAGFRPTEAFLRSIIGIPLRQQMQLFSFHPPSEAELERRVAFAIERFEHYVAFERPFAPAVQALIALRRCGYPIALVTSKSAPELDSFMDRFEAAPFVDAAVCASDVHHPKPHGDSATLACARLGVSPEEAILIGDSVFDLQCARNARLAANAAVTYGAGDRNALLAERPDFVFDTPDALLEWANLASLTHASIQEVIH